MRENTHLLLTGATGFIGGHAARALAGSGTSMKVLALVRRGTDEEKLQALRQAGVIPVEGDITDPDTVRDIFHHHKPARVVHLAALCGSGKGRSQEYRRVNVGGTETLLQEALRHGVERFIFCSSVGVHGTIPQELPADNHTPLVGDTEYHRSKILGEAAVQRAMRNGLDAVIVRPTITYGAGDTGFPATLVDLVRKRRFLLPPKDVLVHLLDVAALCRLFCLLLSGDPAQERVIIAADRAPVPLADLVHEIHRHHYGTAYPSLLSLPRLAARLLSVIPAIVGSDTWRTRIRLISRSWYYQTGNGPDGVQYEPPDTLTSFPESMCR